MLLALLIGVALLGIQLWFDNQAQIRQDQREQRATLRAERLENLRFVRQTSSGKLQEDRSFRGIDLAGQDLSGLRLSGADFSNADLRDATLDLADLREVDFSGARLQGASLWGARLAGADFYRTRLHSADLGSTVLSYAMFTKADLSDVDFSDAFINHTWFAAGTVMEDVHDLPDADDRGAIYSDNMSCIDRKIVLPGPVPTGFSRDCDSQLDYWYEDQEVIPGGA